MLTTRVVRMCYPRNVQYLTYKILGKYDTCTSKCSSKLRYKGIETVYIGVKLLYKHNRTPQGSLKQRFLASSFNDSMKRIVDKIRQDNLAFRMNATFLEVLQEVLSGLLIPEPNVEGGLGESEKRKPGTLKRIPSQSGFAHFGCHGAVYPRERKREHNTS